MALRLNDGLGRRAHIELLDHALPPTFRDLNFNIVAASLRTYYPPPEGLGSNIGWHLPDLPGAWMTPQRMQCQRTASANAAVPLEHEKLLHPPTFFSGDDRRSHKGETDVLSANLRDVRVESLPLPVSFQVVAVLRFGVRLLRPDVRQFVLVKLQHLLQRRKVFWPGLAELELHGICGLTLELSGRQRLAAWPALKIMPRTEARARPQAVGSPLERRVRPQWLHVE